VSKSNGAVAPPFASSVERLLKQCFACFLEEACSSWFRFDRGKLCSARRKRRSVASSERDGSKHDFTFGLQTEEASLQSRLHAEEQIFFSMSKNSALGSKKGFLLCAGCLQVERRGVDRLRLEMNPSVGFDNSFRSTVFCFVLNNICSIFILMEGERRSSSVLCSLYSSALTEPRPHMIWTRTKAT
jgi:hypothetical protein